VTTLKCWYQKEKKFGCGEKNLGHALFKEISLFLMIELFQNVYY